MDIYTTLRDEVAAVILLGDSVGQIKTQWPVETSSADWVDTFGAWFDDNGQDKRRIQCWIVEWTSQDLVPAMMGALDSYIHTVSCHFYRQVSDEDNSEQHYLQTLQNVKSQLQDKGDFSSAIVGQNVVSRVENEGVVLWGRYLCHKGTITVAVEIDE